MYYDLELEASLKNLPTKHQNKINTEFHQIGVDGDQISMLGIEDFYGNVWSLIDGFYVKDDGYYITEKPLDFGDIAKYTHYIATPVAGDNSNDFKEFYFKNIEKIGMFNIPRTTGGNDKQYYTDYFWSHRKEQTNICLAGGDLYHARRVGSFCLSLSYIASGASSTFGARLVYLP